jgi:hypothetical protein
MSKTYNIQLNEKEISLLIFTLESYILNELNGLDFKELAEEFMEESEDYRN